MDPYLCCLLGICCPELSEQQRQMMAKILVDRGICETMDAALKVADFHIRLVESFKAYMKSHSHKP